MKIVFWCLILLLNSLATYCQSQVRHIWVNGYNKSDGTYVPGYYRTSPNQTNVDNFSTVGNVNPYNNKKGWVKPDNYKGALYVDNNLKELEVQPLTTGTYENITIENSNDLIYKSLEGTNFEILGNCIGDQVNVRFQPSLNSKIAFRINKNDSFIILNKSKNESTVINYGTDFWYEIKLNNLTGWVFGKFITLESKNNIGSNVNEGSLLRINKNYVNVRTEPNIFVGKVIFMLNHNDRVEVIAKTFKSYYIEGYGEDVWYYVKYKNRYGWVFGTLASGD